MKWHALLIPAALMLVAPVERPVYAQASVYAGCAVEARADSTTIAAPGLSLTADWSAANTLGPFVPETRVDADGNRTWWNSEGYTGRTEWPWLVETGLMGRRTLVGRTLQGSPAGQGRAVYVRVVNVRAVAVGQVEPGGWVDRYVCDVLVTVEPWPAHPGDANRDGVRTPGDIWYFTSQYMSGHPQADFDGDGAVTMADLFDFLAAYFAA